MLLQTAIVDARPQEWEYTAVGYVYDHNGNPKANIRVALYVSATDENTGEYIGGAAYGYSNSYGLFIVTYYIEGSYEPIILCCLGCNTVILRDPGVTEKSFI